MITHFPDIPRVYTALSESLSCLLICLPLLKEKDWKDGILRSLIALAGQVILQLAAGQIPIFFWTIGMLANVAWMFTSIRFLGVHQMRTAFYLTAKAFIAAELVASVSWHLYCLIIFQSPADNLTTQALLMTVLYSLVFYLISIQEKKLALEDLEKSMENRDVWVAVFSSLAIFVVSNIGFILSGTQQFQDSTSIFLLRTVVNLAGILLLFNQESQQYDRYLREELSSINSMFQMQYKQYQAYRENSELIGRKVHDLKHQLAIIRQESDKEKQDQYLEEMTEAIQNFEAKIETGNLVLDTILTQKNQYCLQNQINFTCIVQGELLNFMDAMDISALFGNAMDNAIEALEKIPQIEKRLITLKVSSHNNFLVIRLDNFDTSNIVLRSDTLPNTSKKNKDYHGIGLKSMDYIAQKYNGKMTLTKEDNWVRLKILIP